MLFIFTELRTYHGRKLNERVTPSSFFPFLLFRAFLFWLALPFSRVVHVLQFCASLARASRTNPRYERTFLHEGGREEFFGG